MKLHEIAQQVIRKGMPEHDSIVEWCYRNNVTSYTIAEQGVINTNQSVSLVDYQESTLPFQFGVVDGNFDCYNARLTSFTGFPHKITGSLYLYDSHIYSLHNIHKTVKFIGERFASNDSVTDILGLLLIGGLQSVQLDVGPIDDIMNKYVGTGDILAAQDELIDAGLKAQARL